MLITLISYLPAIIGLLLIGFFVYVSNPKAQKNRIFTAQSLFMTLWLSFLLLSDISADKDSALWVLRGALFFGSLMMLAFYHFSLVFPYKTKLSRISKILTSVPAIIVGLVSLTPLVVSSVEIHEFGVQPENVGIFYAITDLMSLTYLIAGFVIIVSKFRFADKRQKSQIKIVLTGLLFALAVNLFTGLVFTLLEVDTNLISLGGFSVFIASLFIGYAIVKHGFLDIRKLVARSLAYTLALGILIFGYASISSQIVGRLFAEGQNNTLELAVNAVVFAAALLLYQPLKAYFDRVTNQLFYRDAYDAQEFLDELNKSVVSNIELGILLRQATAVIEKHLKCSFCFVEVRETENTPFRIIGAGQARLAKEDTAYIRDSLFGMEKKIIVTDDLRNRDARLRHTLLKNDISVVVRLKGSPGPGEQSIAYLILGPKKSGNVYGKQDLRIIDIIADELTVAIQNALRFEEIQGFAAKLQAEVNAATAKLQRTNKKLRELDETKDEFISMASHQLRTPLTSVKGYMSMVLEGDAGELKKQQKDLLNQAFVSSQRMVYLIADLLNVSRLKTGKFVIESLPTNLAEVVEGEISQLKEVAKSKKLSLAYKKPKNFPTLMLDETKIRQVIMNFADNAIYYTPSGGKIHIELTEDKNNIYFTVKDNGLGVPASEQRHLFTKFYRAKNARKARPDGTGLGLFMAKKVINAQGGDIIFESREGHGSTFGFTFNKSKLSPQKAPRNP